MMVVIYLIWFALARLIRRRRDAILLFILQHLPKIGLSHGSFYCGACRKYGLDGMIRRRGQRFLWMLRDWESDAFRLRDWGNDAFRENMGEPK